MPTEMLTKSSLAVNSAATGSPLKGIKSVQKPTIRYDDFSFGDALNLFNPLHFIPGVSTLYHASTGTKASPVSSLIGGALFGGPLGFVMAGINAVFEEATSKGVLGSVADAIMGETQPQTEERVAELAAAKPAPRDYSARYRQIANAHKPDYRWQDQA